MTRTALYLRISQDRLDNQLAIERQRAACLALVDAGSPVREFVDNNVSASSARVRPQYQALLAAAQAGEFEQVIVYDLDRLTRKPREIEDWLDMAEKSGVRLRTVSDDLDLASDNGRMFLRIKAAVARAEVERKSARQVAANKQRAEKGIPTTGRRPYGFENDRLTPRESEAVFVRDSYSRVLAGESIYNIVRRLNDSGQTSTMGKPWTAQNLRQLLRNPRNAGHMMRDGLRLAESQITALVSEQDYADVNAILAGRSERSGPKIEKGILTGIMLCACGLPMVQKSVSNRRGGRDMHYMCQSRAYKTPAPAGAQHVTISSKMAHRAIRQAVLEHAAKGSIAEPTESAAALRKVALEQAEIRAQQASATDALLVPGADMTRVSKRLSDLQKAAQALEAERVRILSEQAQTGAFDLYRELVGGPNIYKEREALAQAGQAWDALTTEQKRAIAQAFRVSVKAGGYGVDRVTVEPLT